jgi:hypothetical protein
MVRRSLKRRIEEIYSRVPPPPPPLEELPIETWVAEIMEAHAPHHNQYDEDFWRWLEELLDNISSSLRERIYEVWGTAGLKKLSPETAAEITKCINKVLPPYIDRYWRQFQAGKGERDERLRAWAELSASVGAKVPFFPNTDTPEEIRRRVDELEAKPPKERLGQDWVIRCHRERADLAERYQHWPEEWQQFYAAWCEEHEEG